MLSIRKRGAALGLLAHTEIEERFTRTEDEMHNLLRIAMGGMVSERLLLGCASSGAAGDLAGATKTAAAMVGAYGLAGSLISVEASNSATGGDLVAKVLSDEPSRKTVESLLESARSDAESLLDANRHVVEALRDALLERDELLGEEILAIVEAARRPMTDQEPTTTGELRTH